MKVTLSKIIFLIAAAAVLTGGIAIGYMHWKPELTRDDQESLRLFREVISVVKARYVDEVDAKKLLESSVTGMLASLDPHSIYMPPEPYKEMKVEMSGSFGGLGIEINVKEDKLIVVAPIDDTPASRAGIMANDHIVKIDDVSTRGMSTVEAVKLMRGTPGTRVTLTISRAGSAKPLVFPLVRDIIKTKSVKYKSLEQGFGYVRISQFRERTGDEFAAALDALRGQNGGALKGLVLDLRYNPGGLVDQAVMVANRYIGEHLRDALIVSIKGRGVAAKQEYNASVGSKEPHYPMVVLINGASASASEIVAGALQDHKRAVIMGTPSFGKGSVQTIYPLAGGAGLKLTTARYYTPSGRSIQAKGISPDIRVGQIDLSAASEKKGTEFHEQDLDKHLPPAREPGGKVDEAPSKPGPAVNPGDDTAHDFQLARALDMLRGLAHLKDMEAAGNPDARVSRSP